MTEDKKEGRRREEGQSKQKSGERRRPGLFAWLGPMLERRTPKVEQVDEDEFEKAGKKK